MSSKQWAALAVMLGVLVGTAAFLGRVASTHHLGRPGVKLVGEPTFMTGGIILRTNSVYLPPTVVDCVSTQVPISLLEATWLPPDTLFGRRHYVSKEGVDTLVSVVLMGTDRTSIHKPQYCLLAQGCQIDKTETTVIRVPKPYPYDLRVMKLTTSRQIRDESGQTHLRRGFYLYWFVADGRLTPYHGERMWWMARDLIRTGVLERWAYVTCFTECWPGEEDQTLARLKEFVASAVPSFQLAAGARAQGSRILFTSAVPER